MSSACFNRLFGIKWIKPDSAYFDFNPAIKNGLLPKDLSKASIKMANPKNEEEPPKEGVLVRNRC